MQSFCKNTQNNLLRNFISATYAIFNYPWFAKLFRLAEKKKKPNEEFLDETPENDEEQVEYLDDEYEEDNSENKE